MRAYYLLTLGIVVSYCFFSTPAITKEISSSRLQKLIQTKVTSVSKKPEDPFYAPAAIYVISKGDIERAGATSIAEALRLAPGLQVSRSSSNQWAIAARGFNDQFSNKLLVMIDGRTVYTPLFSGVYWDVQDVVLEDIKHIEIIRGPGASLWGANAVNGVINIITEEAVNTLDTLVSLVGGTDDNIVSARVGKELTPNLHYRTYFKYTNREEFTALDGSDANDDWRMYRGGFRADWEKDSRFISVQGDVYSGREDQRLFLPTTTTPFITTTNEDEEVSGGNVLVNWEDKLSDGSILAIQSYYDYIQRNSIFLQQKRSTFDLDIQHALKKKNIHELTWGLGYRLVTDDLDGTELLSYSPNQRTDNLYSAFIQDKIHLTNHLFLTFGSKFEHNNYTGFEVQPSARLAWHISERQMLWSSVSRAIRVPNRNMDDVSFAAVGTPFGFFRFVGNRTTDAEELVAYEVGYRSRPHNRIFIDVTTFYNDYDKLATSTATSALTATVTNDTAGEAYGTELSFKWDVNNVWAVNANYSFLKINLDSGTASSVTTEKKSPQHQFNLGSHLLLPRNFELNNHIYYVDNLSAVDVDSYVRFDMGISWKPVQKLKFSLVGQNLFDHRHQEFSEFIYNESKEVGRSAYIKANLVF